VRHYYHSSCWCSFSHAAGIHLPSFRYYGSSTRDIGQLALGALVLSRYLLMHKNSPVYLDIAQSIRKDIQKRGLGPHARLPSEPELARKFRAARATVRRALAKLQDDGLIYSRRAVGSFVAEPRIEQDLDQLFSFTELMVFRGIKPGSKLITAEAQRVSGPDSPLLHYLALRPGAKVWHVRRLRLGGKQPLVIANTWLPVAQFPRFPAQDLERRSIYEIMKDAGCKPTDAIQTMEAVTLGPEEAHLLGVKPGSSAFLIRRVAYSNGIPVEYAIDYYRGDRTKFRVRLGVLERRLGERSQSPSEP
jgi:DNA-binding GntR family transcriptional regulator